MFWLKTNCFHLKPAILGEVSVFFLCVEIIFSKNINIILKNQSFAILYEIAYYFILSAETYPETSQHEFINGIFKLNVIYLSATKLAI